ncbi:hypothetical protein MHUMG1_07930 [Metarhizium humberi]|uniref:Ribonuclease n=1 Tax=Metarhizium humberi TaxID=2596975 RepID=A0A9P8S411_9HYPO|nr:hypothetical protein MHUMG1_07930 [Metarhizium humberi]
MAEADETPPSPSTFLPPSVHREALLAGSSFTHFSPVPPALLTPARTSDPSSLPPLCLGVDEAGRGPVLGPMVYGILYLPLPQSDPLLRDAHGFDDSKALTAAARSSLMRALCTAGTDLHAQCGWATAALSARDISAGMLRPSGGAYNLNAQAMDATVALVRGVLERGLNVREVYVDTVGPPATYQARLQRVFPTIKITVAKKADSLYPCVSAASVCAKVTRDAALEVLYEARPDENGAGPGMEWGSGYPSDARCVAWLRRNMHPVFGWGPECRFSWGTAKDILETKGGVRVDWPVEEEAGDSMRVTDFFAAGRDDETDELGGWYGSPAGLEAF